MDTEIEKQCKELMELAKQPISYFEQMDTGRLHYMQAVICLHHAEHLELKQSRELEMTKIRIATTLIEHNVRKVLDSRLWDDVRHNHLRNLAMLGLQTDLPIEISMLGLQADLPLEIREKAQQAWDSSLTPAEQNHIQIHRRCRLPSKTVDIFDNRVARILKSGKDANNTFNPHGNLGKKALRSAGNSIAATHRNARTGLR